MTARVLIILLLSCGLAFGQSKSTGDIIPQGSGIPGLGGVGTVFNGPGYLEFGGAHSALTGSDPNWNDFYVRGQLSGGNNAVMLESMRQGRFGDSGWWFSGGWNRIFNPNWYADFHVGTSVGGFFLPKLRTDAFINRKLLTQKQLILTFGGGYDRSKRIDQVTNAATRVQVGATYYFNLPKTDIPLIAQGGVNWTHANPGAILARAQYLAITEGHEKEHYITVRAEIGREGYELFGNEITQFNFPIHNYSATWRQWIGLNWGFNAVFEHDGNPYYRRNGGSLGVFFEF